LLRHVILIKSNSIEAGYNTKLSLNLEKLYIFLKNFNIDIIINNDISMDEKETEYLKVYEKFHLLELVALMLNMGKCRNNARHMTIKLNQV
jgi:hypothetical protein